jgi:hypothetical protein
MSAALKYVQTAYAAWLRHADHCHMCAHAPKATSGCPYGQRLWKKYRTAR